MIRHILAALLIAGPAFGQSVTQPQIPPGTPGNIVSIGPGGVAGDSLVALATAPQATGVAATDVANLQAALTAIPITGGRVTTLSGTYVLNQPVFIKSNTILECAAGTVFQASSSFVNGNGTSAPAGYPMLVNTDWNVTALTDANITVRGCGFDYTPLGGISGTHAIRFYWTSHVRIDRVNCLSGNDCTAMIAGSDTSVVNSWASGGNNACWDHWFHPMYTVVKNNYCNTNGGAGVLIQGTNGSDASVAVGGEVSGNTILGAATAGVWVGTTPTGATGSGANGIVVARNYINGIATAGVCVKVDGNSEGNIVKDNNCWNAVGSNGAIQDITDAGGTPSDTVIADNLIYNWGTTGTYASIWSAGSSPRIHGNRVRTGSYAFALSLTGSGGESIDNFFGGGANGTYYTTGGTGYVIKDIFPPPPNTPSSCGTTPTFATNSTNNGWTLNVGSGTVTACTFTFRPALSAPPACTVSSAVSGANPYISAISATGITITTAVSVGATQLTGTCTQPGM